MPFPFDAPEVADPGAHLADPVPARMEAGTYWARLMPHLARFGISRVADITGLDRVGYPVAQACRPAARSNIVTQGKGPSLAAAVWHGLFECIENDARLRAGAAGRLTARPLAGELERAAAGLRTAAYDITARAGPPVVMVRVMEDPDEAPALPLPADGFACRPDPEDALAAALAEALQTRLSVISGAREDITARSYAHDVPREALLAEWQGLATPFRVPLPGAWAAPASVADAVRAMPEIGPVLAVPLVLEPDTPLAVARVLVPGLATDPEACP